MKSIEILYKHIIKSYQIISNHIKSLKIFQFSRRTPARCWPPPAGRAPGGPGAPCRDAGAAGPAGGVHGDQQKPKRSSFLMFPVLFDPSKIFCDIFYLFVSYLLLSYLSHLVGVCSSAMFRTEFLCLGRIQSLRSACPQNWPGDFVLFRGPISNTGIKNWDSIIAIVNIGMIFKCD